MVHNWEPPPTKSGCPSATQCLPPLQCPSLLAVSLPSPAFISAPIHNRHATQAISPASVPPESRSLAPPGLTSLPSDEEQFSLSTCDDTPLDVPIGVPRLPLFAEHKCANPRSSSAILAQFFSWDSWSKTSKTAQTTLALKWPCWILAYMSLSFILQWLVLSGSVC